MDHFLYQIFKVITEYIIKKHETVSDNPPIRIYVHKIEKESYLESKQGLILNF